MKKQKELTEILNYRDIEASLIKTHENSVLAFRANLIASLEKRRVVFPTDLNPADPKLFREKNNSYGFCIFGDKRIALTCEVDFDATIYFKIWHLDGRDGEQIILSASNFCKIFPCKISVKKMIRIIPWIAEAMRGGMIYQRR